MISPVVLSTQSVRPRRLPSLSVPASFNPLPFLDRQLCPDGSNAVSGRLVVHDPLTLPFLAIALDAPSIATAAPPDLRVRVAPDLEECSITPFGSNTAAAELILDDACSTRRGVAPLSDAPLVRRGNFWFANFVLRHPHAWDLIDGPAARDVHRLILSVANSGIAKAVSEWDYVSRCLCALMPGQSANVAAEVQRIVRNAGRKQDGRALYIDVSYEAGRRGPVPLGYTKRGHFVFHDRGPDEVRLAHADRVLSPQYLELMAPMSFWVEQYGWRGRLNATWAGEALMQACFQAGRYQRRRRTRNREGKGNASRQCADQTPSARHLAEGGRSERSAIGEGSALRYRRSDTEECQQGTRDGKRRDVEVLGASI